MKPQNTITVEETMNAWLVWENTDKTEGRGFLVVSAVCQLEATAIRLAKGCSTQGCDGSVTKQTIFKHDDHWLAPCQIEYPTEGDKNNQRGMDMKAEVIRKALAAGLNETELKLLQTTIP